MKPIKILEEVKSHHWAMTPESLRAMLSALDNYDISADDYHLFHALDKELKLNAVENFGRKTKGLLYTSVKGHTGFLQIDGPIIPRATWFSDVSGMVSLDMLTSEFKALESNEEIDTIVLVMDSPGGVVTGVSDFSALVKASSKHTETFAWMAASAAYEIASATNKITTPDTGLVGSIGTVLSVTDRSVADAKRGIKEVEIVSSQSPNKRPDITTAEGRQVLQTLVNEIADVFVFNVAKNRNVTTKTVLETFGAGAVFAAARAHNAGMIDAIVDLDTFMESFGEDNASLMGFGFSAELANNQGEIEMTDAEKAKIAAEESQKKQLEANAKIEADATTKERDRLKSIEAIADKFDSALPAVKAKAVEYINANKYMADTTPESVALGLVDVVAKAQVQAVDDFGAGPRAGAKIAGKVAGAVVPNNAEEVETEASEKRTTALCAARKAEQGGN